MRVSSRLLPTVGCGLSLLLLSLLLLVPLAPAALFTPVQPPSLDLGPLGRIALTGNFDAISLYQYEQQKDGSNTVLNGSQAKSLIAPLPNGALAPVASVDADILALCSLTTTKKDDSSVVVVGGNFTSLGGVESPALALFDPSSGKVTAVSDLSGQVLALLCDPDSNAVYVGGDFKAPDSSNAIVWSPEDGVSNLVFGGFNGPVTSIVKTQGKHIVFGGSFDGLGNMTGPSQKDQQVVNLQTAEVSSGSATTKSDFSDPRNVICNGNGDDGPGKTWLLADNSPGYWRASMKFGFRPTKLRVRNTHHDGRGTKAFRFTALPDMGILNMTYTDKKSGDTVACDAACPLSDDPDEDFRDFRFVNVVGMSGFQLDISEWYGQGGGFAGIELLEDGMSLSPVSAGLWLVLFCSNLSRLDIYAYAVNDFNEPACANIRFGSQSAKSGSWDVSPRKTSYDYLGTQVDSASDSPPSVTFKPDIQQSGNYSVTVFTPGCVDDGTCGNRGVANVTATLTKEDTKPIELLIYQTNNFEKYDQLYLGQVDASGEEFRPTVTLTPKTGQRDDVEIVASRVRFQLISSTGGLNGLFEFDPSQDKVDKKDFSASAINKAGIDLDRGASIRSLESSNELLFVGGNFSNASVGNVLSIKDGSPSSLPDGGLNSEVRDLLLKDELLYVGGNFTDTSNGDNNGLQYVGAYSTSNNSWVPLGSGVNGPVHSLVRFPVNISEDTMETAVAVNGEFTRINAYGDFPSVPAPGFAIWVPSQVNWLEQLSVNQMAYVGQLSASVKTKNTTLLAGNLASGGISSHGAASLSDKDELVLYSLPVDIQLAQSELPPRKRAAKPRQAVGVTTGVFDNDSSRNATILAGHFTARATDGSTIENILFLDGSDDDKVTGSSPGIDSESSFLAMAIKKDLLFAGGTVSGTVSKSDVNGMVIYDLTSGQYSDTQPGSLNGDSVVVNTIAPRPDSSDVYVGGQFDSAASLPCPGICNFRTDSSQWRRLGAGLEGTVNVMDWASSETLIVAGNLTVSDNQTMLAKYNAKKEKWSVIDGKSSSSSSITGPITSLGFAEKDGSRFWVSGKSPKGATFLMYYDGADFHAVDSTFGEQTTVEGIQIIALSEDHADTDYLDKDQALLVTGQLQLPKVGLISAALFNGTTMTPFIFSSMADGGPGTIVGLFSEHENSFSGGCKYLLILYSTLT